MPPLQYTAFAKVQRSQVQALQSLWRSARIKQDIVLSDNKDNQNNTFGLEQAACFLHINKCTARELAASGRLPGAKIGRAWVFLEQDLIDWLRDQVRIQQQQRLAGNNYARQRAANQNRNSRRRPIPELPELPGKI
ncbi:MAG: helix-turn-helix domain-containing protein [Gammaproteobacteria bacterium]|nr:helix-turn-helix domain-containing protein [Gammaproteobacteria bacterium]